MLPSKVTLELSPQMFAYLQRVVERDIEDAKSILIAEDCEHTEEELSHARRMQQLLHTVEQVQVYSH